MTNTRFQQQPIFVNGVKVAIVQAFPGRRRVAHDGSANWTPGDGTVWRVFTALNGEAGFHPLSVCEYRSAEDATRAFLAAAGTPVKKPAKRKGARRAAPPTMDAPTFRRDRLHDDRLEALLADRTDGHTVTLGLREVAARGRGHQPTLYRYPVLINGSGIGHIEAVRNIETGPKRFQGRPGFGERLVTRWAAHPAALPAAVKTFRTRKNAADYLAALTIAANGVTVGAPAF